MIKPKSPKYRRYIQYAALCACGPLAFQAAYGQDEEEDVFELSPFTVDASDNTGYRATSTLAGTRIKTDLKDLGSAISVITAEFMEDTGTTNAEDLLVYTASTEVGGAMGNFAGSAIASGNQGENSKSRANPAGNNRVRGLSRAATTRDYFQTSFGFDGYNSQGVTINRGPNSILFGIGEPGGVIESSTRKAMLHKNSGQVSLRLGSRGSHRETLDVNRVLVEDRLGIRLMAMNEKINFQQKPTYENDKRWTLAATWKALTNENVSWMGPTTIRANYEKAKITGTPPNTMPPVDLYSHWWEPVGNPIADAMVGKDNTEYNASYASKWVFDDFYKTDTTPGNKKAGQPGIWNSYAIVYADASTGAPGVGLQKDVQVIDGNLGAYTAYDANGVAFTTPTMPLRSTNLNPWNGYAGFQRLTIQDPEVFDFENHFIPGLSQFANHDFEAKNIVLEQNFMENKFGFQVAFDSQEKDTHTHFPLGRANYHAVVMDAALYKANGELNPNVGRPMIAGMWDPEDFSSDNRKTMRSTAFFKHNFTESDGWTRWLGDHSVTGLYNEYENDRSNYAMRLSWDDAHDPDQNFVLNQNKVGSWGGSMFFMAYVGDDQFDTNSSGDLRLYQGSLNLQKPKAGDEYTNYYYDKFSKTLNYSTIKVQEFLQWPGGSRQEIDSKAYTVQSKFLNGHLSAIYGWREDSTSTWQIRNNDFRDPDTLAYTADAFTDGWIIDANTTGTFANAVPVLAQTGETETRQLVGHLPEGWLDWSGGAISSLSAHYVESENFNPASVRRDVYNDVIGSPNGKTEEHGITIGLLENKAIVRLAWYETTSNNINNPNMQGNLWQIRWPVALAQRWVQAKNQSFEPGGRSFEDYAWYGPNGAGPELDGAVYLPERLGNFNSFDEVIAAFDASWPVSEEWNTRLEGDEGSQEFKWDTPQGMSTVASAISEGFEIELTYNITKNWRASFNATKAESVFGGGLTKVGPLLLDAVQGLKDQGLWTIADTPGEGGTTEGRYSNSAVSSYYSALSKENTVATELRKWRWNAVTNYSFKEGALKGIGIGGAVRWQDDVSTGYPLVRNDLDILVPDLDNPYKGGSSINGDLWFSFKTKVADKPIKFQVNMQNVWGDDEPIPVVHNPDGALAIVRTPAEKRIFLTTTLDF